MKALVFLWLITGYSIACAQPAGRAVEDKNLNLEDRYKEMKSGSQTFKDYKVIKEVILDKVWKITIDTVEKRERQLAEANKQIAGLEEELANTRKAMQAQQDAVKDITYDSTHITILGIPFLKSIFIIMTAAIIGSLIFVISIAFARVKMANSLAKEKTLIADSIAHELEDFKKRAMEKQTKLSRELQNERNKWQDYRKA